MDYSRIYIDLIERARYRVLDTYTEKHHVVPKCMGGDNKERNIVRLTPEEHYVAHQLLAKIYPDNSRLVWALAGMSGDPLKKRNAKIYGWIRRKNAQTASERFKGKKQSKEHVKKRMATRKSNGFGHGSETRIKMSLAKKGKPNGKKGIKRRPYTEEERLKFSVASTQKKPVLKIDKQNGTILARYESLTHAGKQNGILTTRICSVCKGRKKSYRGFVWKYDNNQLN